MNGEGFAFFAWIRYRGRWLQCAGTGWGCVGCQNEWKHLQRWRYGWTDMLSADYSAENDYK